MTTMVGSLSTNLEEARIIIQAAHTRPYGPSHVSCLWALLLTWDPHMSLFRPCENWTDLSSHGLKPRFTQTSRGAGFPLLDLHAASWNFVFKAHGAILGAKDSSGFVFMTSDHTPKKLQTLDYPLLPRYSCSSDTHLSCIFIIPSSLSIRLK